MEPAATAVLAATVLLFDYVSIYGNPHVFSLILASYSLLFTPPPPSPQPTHTPIDFVRYVATLSVVVALL